MARPEFSSSRAWSAARHPSVRANLAPPPTQDATARRIGLLTCLALFLAALAAAVAPLALSAADVAEPDVVLVVDTSRSMSRPGMDPERTSLLVSKLFSDILPGDLAVVRLLDLTRDAGLLPRRQTGLSGACDEDPTQHCNRIEPTADWAQLARDGTLGTLPRPRRGDADFKQRLDAHLAQTSHNSLFYLAFHAAHGVFEQHGGGSSSGRGRTLIWLSDGRDEGEALLAEAVRDLEGAGVKIETIIFGRGDPTIPTRIGLAPVRVRTPGELMASFAQAFRRIMGAPYQIDHLVEEQPNFDVQPKVETMWVVVYGDHSLESVTLTDAAGRTHGADYAADSLPRAGAYRVARIDAPAPGRWQLETRGGGSGRAYAVVQLSSLAPSLQAPEEARADVETTLVAAITPRDEPDTPIVDHDLIAEARIRATIDGTTLELNDRGEAGDALAGDGLFSGRFRFTHVGETALTLTLQSPLVEARGEAVVRVKGTLRVTGEPLDARLGEFAAGQSRCVTLAPKGEHRGSVPVRLHASGGVPFGHDLFVRLAGERLDIDTAAIEWRAGAPLVVCLDVAASAPSSTSTGERLLTIAAVGGTDADQRLDVRLYWDVAGLGFWQRWAWLFLLILAVLVVTFVALGFVLPKRFPATLAINIAPEQDDIEEYPPQSIRIWRGVGIGFYRDARAYLHADYRLSGRASGALARLRAIGGAAAEVEPQGGYALYREQLDGDWRDVPPTGEIARPGEIYRVGDNGPFFRLSAR